MIEIYRGDTFSRTVKPKNFTFETGDKIRIGAKNLLTDKQAVFEVIHTFEETATEYTFTFSAETMAKIAPKSYIFEIEITKNNNVQTVLQDELTIKGDVLK